MTSRSICHQQTSDLGPKMAMTDAFPQFSRLPCEIRLKIWEQALSYKRIICISLGMVIPHNKPKEYRLAIPQQQVMSKLFHINSESRHVAIRFYRVQVPCRYGKRHQSTEENGTFYFNPELDTLAISGVWNTFPEFAHNLWVHDPKNVGLINLMVCEDASYWPTPNERFNMPLLRQVVSRLECVIFGRTFLGLKTDPNGFMSCNPHWIRIVPKFEKLSYNATPMETHLKHVDLGPKDLRRDVYDWLKALLRWQVEYSDHAVDYRVLVGFTGPDSEPEILKGDDGFRWVGYEEWRAALPPIRHLALLYARSININPHPIYYQSTSSTVYEMTDTFPQFPRLPREIRLMIWELSLHRKRILHVDLTFLRLLTEPWKWAPILSQQNAISKLFRVNSESRYAALRFYRVHLPCEYQCRGRVEKNGTFYFNPELDIIEVTGWKKFAEFAHSLWVNDPRHVGLINLMLTRYDDFEGIIPEQTNMPLLRQTVSRLKHIIFGCIFLALAGEPLEHVWPRHYDIIPDFDRSTYDFRSMQAHLRDIDLCRDLRSVQYLEWDIDHWLAILALWQVQYHDHEVDYRLMFSHLGKHDEPGTGDRSDRSRWVDFAEWVNWEQIEQSNTYQQLRPRLALGFWLIPMEACAASLSKIRRKYGLRACADRSIDLAELYLFHLPRLA
ncbi:hypothetical protein FDECE_1450 [Fusarium decemcellulare]|nr:hypothetical protein FDECE_1450 [Fusarium decemcellulare]